MFNENKILESLLRFGRRVIPKRVFNFFQPSYHKGLALIGSGLYRWPSRSLKVIGVTGTHGKTTTCYMIAQAFLAADQPVAAINTMEFRINETTWPNSLKMTMPGRFQLQKFIRQAKKAGCKYLVLEVSSEGIKQFRHLGISFDCAVLTGIGREHLDSHGGFENYVKAKQQLFRVTKNIHVLNAESDQLRVFENLPSKTKILYGLSNGQLTQKDVNLELQLAGSFNISNALAAISVAKAYGLDLGKVKEALENIESIAGRMEFIQKEPFTVVVDYAHTPEELEKVYQTLRPYHGKLIGVFGATGGGRDKWKRPEFGKIAERYCNQIILTTDDPYDDDPAVLAEEITSGIHDKSKVQVIIDRREAIQAAVAGAQPGDVVAITGKGSEDRMVFAERKKIPWSDKEVAERELQNTKASGRGEAERALDKK